MPGHIGAKYALAGIHVPNKALDLFQVRVRPVSHQNRVERWSRIRSSGFDEGKMASHVSLVLHFPNESLIQISSSTRCLRQMAALLLVRAASLRRRRVDNTDVSFPRIVMVSVDTDLFVLGMGSMSVQAVPCCKYRHRHECTWGVATNAQIRQVEGRGYKQSQPSLNSQPASFD